MRHLSLVVTVSAIAIGSASSTVAQELFNPPAALQQVPVPGRIFIAPPAKPAPVEATLPVPQPLQPSHADRHATSAEVAAAAELKQPITVLNAADPSRFLDVAVGGELESPAAGLNGTVAVDATPLVQFTSQPK